MRISDWSSDVCSSDLGSPLSVRLHRSRELPRSQSPATRCCRTRPSLRRSCDKGASRPAWARQAPADPHRDAGCRRGRSEEHTSELQSLMRISYAVFCLKKKQKKYQNNKEIKERE